MAFKWAAAAVAVGLLGAYVLALAIKLREIDLGVVILIGLTLMLVDLWQSLQSKED
jgi:hypothetical protein